MPTEGPKGGPGSGESSLSGDHEPTRVDGARSGSDGEPARAVSGGTPRQTEASFLARYRALLGPLTVVTLFVVAMFWSPFEPHPLPADPSGSPGGEVTWDDADWAVFSRSVRSAVEAGADTLPMRDLMVHIGLGLVGTPYEAGTLEVEGPERLVVNFGALDCVTFVENVYAMAAAVKSGVGERLDERGAVEGEYERMLRALRYRGNVIDGYPSRLHYFTEWLLDAEAKQLVQIRTEELGGVVDEEPIDFMSTHPDAYRQLADPESLETIRRVEDLLSAYPRRYIPEDRIAAVSDRIGTGDIIAATSTVAGLDVAHTGLAVRVDGELRLLHAPLVGDSVQLSDRTLAERIVAIEGQDGIMVATPQEPRATSSRLTGEVR